MNAMAEWALLVGIGLGLVQFGGLWWTVHRLPTFSRPLLLLLASAAVRGLTVLAGLRWMALDSPQALALALFALVMTRTGLVLRWKPMLGQEVRPCS